MMMNLKNLFQRAVELAPYLTAELGTMVGNIKSPTILADLIASNLNLSTSEKQAILETFDVRERLSKVHLFLNKEVQVLELGNKIQSQVKEDMDRTQREYYLREQLKAIKKELGELDEHSAEIKELKEKIKKAKMPPEAQTAAEKELDRLAKIPPASAEYTVARTYLDWLAELPWSESTEDNLDINASPEDPGRRPLRSGEGEETDPGVSGRSEVEGEHERADSLFCRASGRGKDLPGKVDCSDHGTEVYANLTRRGPG